MVRKNRQAIKLFIVLIFCTAYIFSFSHYGALALAPFHKETDVFPQGTSFGTISVEGKTIEEATTLLNQKYDEWLNNAEISLQYKEKTVKMDKRDFSFLIQDSVFGAKDGQQNTIQVKLENEKTAALIGMLSSSLSESQFDLNKLTIKLTTIAANLQPGNTIIKLGDFLKETTATEQTVIGEAWLTPKNIPDDMEEAIEKLSQIEIPAESTFSMLEYLKSQKLNNLSVSALSLISSSIYKAILPTNFSVLERKIGEDLPANEELGFESKIDFGNNFDLVFSNPNDTAYTIELEWNGTDLQTALKGEPLLYEYKVSLKNKQDFKPKTIKQYSPLLVNSQKKIQNEGSDGAMIKVFREIYDNGKLLDSDLISEDFYAPVARVEITALPAGQDTGGAVNPSGVQPNTSDSQPAANAETTTVTEEGTNQSGSKENLPETQEQNVLPSVSNNENLWGKPNEQPK